MRYSIKVGQGALGRPLFLLCALILLSCAHELKPVHSTLLDVPFFPQEAHQCGPAALASILNYLGSQTTPAEIASEIYSESAGGVLGTDLENYSSKQGFTATSYKGNIEDIKARIDANMPLIILVDHGKWVYSRPHFMAVVGYTDSGVIVHTGKDKFKKISLRELEGPWAKCDNWTLLIRPK